MEQFQCTPLRAATEREIADAIVFELELTAMIVIAAGTSLEAIANVIHSRDD